MPFVNGDTLKTFEANTARLDAVEAENRRLGQELRVARAAGTVVADTEALIIGYMEDTGLLEKATALARFNTEEAERKRVTTELSQKIQAEQGAEFAAAFRTANSDSIAEALREQFAADGTFDRIRQAAEGDVRREIREGILVDEKSKIDAELTAPATREAFVERVRQEVTESPDLKDYRKKTSTDLERTWRTDVEGEEKKRVIAEEEAREQAFKAKIRPGIASSNDTDWTRQSTRQRLEQKWREQTSAEVLSSLDSDELARLVKAKERLEADKKEENKVKAELEAYRVQFEGSGIPTESIPANTKLTVYLGAVSAVKVKYTGNYGGEQTKSVPGVDCQRTIKLFALDGTGRFRVDHDSLNDSSSAYERNDAIEKSTIIVIGHKLKENGTENFVRLLSSESTFYYDDDTTNDHVISGHLPVSQIDIDGKPIRDLQVVQRAK